jgi:pSer/pThr/pTyr-binding forkhead associated (FHA) protein
MYNDVCCAVPGLGGDPMAVNLVLLKKNGLQKIFALPSETTVIGRRHDCDLCIPLMSVSRRHCQLYYDGKKLKIRDLGSHNGTLVNGQRVEESEVQPGDAIKIGPLAFVTQIDGVPENIRHPASASETGLLNESHGFGEIEEEHESQQTMSTEKADDLDALSGEFLAADGEGGDAEMDSFLDDFYTEEPKN